jgi:REP element-mobilizing transposase RayT
MYPSASETPGKRSPNISFFSSSFPPDQGGRGLFFRPIPGGLHVYIYPITISHHLFNSESIAVDHGGLAASTSRIVRRERGVLLAAGGVEDHMHLFVSMKPDVALSDLVRDIKANSTNWIHQEMKELPQFAWQGGYSAFTVSMSRSAVIEKYISKQREHHQETSFRDELIKLLKLHKVEFKEEYLQ